MIQFSAPLLLAAALAGCSDNTDSIGGNTGATTGTTTGTGTTPTAVAGTLAMGTDKNFIPTDNSTVATLTATVVDTSNALMPGTTVSFSTTTGNLSASTATTDANGQAVVTLKSGLADFSNRTAVVTATAGTQSASVPIDITGSTVTLDIQPSNTIQVGTSPLKLITATATVKNASSLGLANQTVRFSMSGSGAGTLSASTLVTNAAGVTPEITFNPTLAGTVTLAAEWLNSAGTVLATDSSDITVTPAAGTAFAVVTPAIDPAGLTTTASQTVKVSVPSIIGNEDVNGNGILDTEDTNGNKILDAGEDANSNGVLDTEDTNGNGTLETGVVASVRLSATAGTFVGINTVTPASASILQAPSNNLVAATYTAPVNSGSVTIQIDALDAAGVNLSSISRTFVVSAPASAAARLIFGASASTLPPSSGGTTRTSTLRVQVQDANYNAVGGAAVLFGLLNTTGSGETVSPAVVLTDSRGEATTTFSAGTASTVGDIYAQVRIVGEDCTFDPGTGAAELNSLCKAIPLKVSSAAVSVTVGFGTTVGVSYDNTQYELPGSVLVVDSNGGPVAGATVTLSTFPAYYRNGDLVIGRTWTGGAWDLRCMGPYDYRTAYWDDFSQSFFFDRETSYVEAEDINRNGILDTGEDTLGNGVIDTWGTNEDVNLNGILDIITEDTNGNGVLDAGEDLNVNGVIDDLTEDTNGNGVLDFGEDLNGNLAIDVLTEDVNGNGILDPNTEDVNLNNVLDYGEDTAVAVGPRNAQAVPANGVLSPPQASAGTVPLTVTTDSKGAAAFKLQYMKKDAWFIKTEVTARVIVQGTESTGMVIQPLLMLQTDAEMDGCPLARRGTY